MSGAAERHLVHGLRVTSPVRLAAGPADDVTPDVAFTRVPGALVAPEGDVIAEVDEGPGGRRHVLVAKDDAIELHLTGAASLTFRRGAVEVDLRLAPSLPEELLPVLLSGPGLVVAGVVAGHDLLHASAVLLPEIGGAVAVVGPTGSGKSTLARLLSGPGRPLLSDDALRVDLSPSEPGRPPTIHRGTTTSRLRGHLGELARLTRGRTGAAGDGRGLLMTEEIAPATAPLRLLLLPRLSPKVTESSIVPVAAAAALPMLASATPLAGLRGHLLLRRQFALAAGLVAAVPVVELWVSWTGEALGAGLAGSLRALLERAATGGFVTGQPRAQLEEPAKVAS